MLGIAGWAAIALISYSSRARKKAEANAPEILDAAFAGQDDVVFKINWESPSYETVLIGAKQRGYALWKETSDTSDGTAKTLIFQRVSSDTPEVVGDSERS